MVMIPFLLARGSIFFFFFLLSAVLGLHRCLGFSLVAESRGYSVVQCSGFSLRGLLLWWSSGSRALGLSSCGSQALRAQAQ